MRWHLSETILKIWHAIPWHPHNMPYPIVYIRVWEALTVFSGFPVEYVDNFQKLNFLFSTKQHLFFADFEFFSMCSWTYWAMSFLNIMCLCNSFEHDLLTGIGHQLFCKCVSSCWKPNTIVMHVKILTFQEVFDFDSINCRWFCW